MSRIIGSRRNEPSRDDEVKEILRNDARVVLDFSCVTSFDNLGLEAALGDSWRRCDLLEEGYRLATKRDEAGRSVESANGASEDPSWR